AATRYSGAPWKNGRSVSTDRHVACARSYDAAIAAGSNDSLRTPLLGLARLTSAMTAGRPTAIDDRIAAAKPRGAGAAPASRRTASSGRSTCAAITSSAFVV